ncbi:MAG TPA: hypothetical protein VGZ23_16220 [bacterium]|nr:hypothetical protein [bacterium]
MAALVRQAVGDGEDLVRFYRAVFAGDAVSIGERRRISLRDRMLAGEWLAARGWGRAPVVIEPPDEPSGPFAPEAAAALKEMPPELRDGIRQWLQERREEYLASERAAAERRMLSYMPTVGPDGNGDGPR